MDLPDAVTPSILVAEYSDVRALQSYKAATMPSSQTLPKFLVPYAISSIPCGAMPTKFVGSAAAADVRVAVPGWHAPAKLHTQLGSPGGSNPFVEQLAAAARFPMIYEQ